MSPQKFQGNVCLQGIVAFKTAGTGQSHLTNPPLTQHNSAMKIPFVPALLMLFPRRGPCVIAVLTACYTKRFRGHMEFVEHFLSGDSLRRAAIGS